MEQLTIFDELDRQTSETAALAAYRHRQRNRHLIPGEQCPACGHVLPGRYDGSHNHGLVTDDVCVGMDLTRRHLAIDLKNGDDPLHSARRAVHAGWPQHRVDAWLTDPTPLLDHLQGAVRHDH